MSTVTASRPESGSLPLVLLAAIITAGVVVAIVSQVLTGERASARDRDFHAAIQVAEGGLQDAYLALSDEADPAIMAVSGAGAVDGDAFNWQAERIGSQNLWEVEVIGEVNNVQRGLSARIGASGLFPFALYGEEFLYVQANAAVYPHPDNLSDAIPTIGTSGETDLGQVMNQITGSGVPEEEYVDLHCHDDEDGNQPDCPVADPNDSRGGAGITFFEQPVNFPDLATRAWAEGEGGACDPTTFVPNDPRRPVTVFNYSNRFAFEPGQVYCLDRVHFEAGGSLGTVAYPIAAGEGDVVIYLNPAGANATALQMDGTGANISIVNDGIAGDASRLQIHVPSGRRLLFTQNSGQIAAAIYAPASACNIRARVEIYGSLICRSVGDDASPNNGNWELYWDERVSRLVTEDIWSATNVTEEIASTLLAD